MTPILFYIGHSQLIDGGLVVVEAYSGAEQGKVRYFQWRKCEHVFQSATIGNCLTRYTCKRCTKFYDVDSSD